MSRKITFSRGLVPCRPVRQADRSVPKTNSGPFVRTKLLDDWAATIIDRRTETPSLGGILLREKGSAEWKVVHLYPDFASRSHTDVLSDLKPGAEYEYRWISFLPDGSYESEGTIRAFRTPVPLEEFPLRNGPWLSNVDATSATIGWRSTVPVPGGIIYRRKGEGEFREHLVHLNGQTLPRNIAQLVDLKGLEPGAEYEYRLACLDPATSRMHYEGDYSFRTFPADRRECKALVLSDHHGDLRFLGNALRGTDAGSEADFVALVGDSVWKGIFQPDGDDLMEMIVDPIVSTSGHSLPIVAMRGNHEWNGPYASDWGLWIRSQAGHCYRAFADGPCFFIALDSLPTSELQRNRYYRELLEEERSWLLEEVIPSKAYRKARFRIAMAHFATFGLPDDEGYRLPFAETVLEPFCTTDPDRRLHLMIGGHMHGYSRVDGDSSTFYAMPDYVTPCRKPSLAGKPVPFPTVINDGPGSGPMEYSALALYADDERLAVKAFDQDLEVFDSFEVDREGRTTTHPTVRRYR